MNTDSSLAPLTPDPGNQPPGQPRRTVLFAAGAAGAALVADRYFAATPRREATVSSQRPAWLTGPASTPTQHDWTALRNKLSTHKLVQPGQKGYPAARTMFDPRFSSLHPAGVAYCKIAADVAACLNFAEKFSMPFRVRSGGHSYQGWSSLNNGLVIDVSDMNSLHVGNGTVTVGTGIDLINFYSGLAAHGKAVPGGSCPTVGIAGLTLGGGIGVLSRIYGLTSDNLQSLQIVTADGSTLTCDSKHHNDLY
jgi:FAD binding domain